MKFELGLNFNTIIVVFLLSENVSLSETKPA